MSRSQRLIFYCFLYALLLTVLTGCAAVSPADSAMPTQSATSETATSQPSPAIPIPTTLLPEASATPSPSLTPTAVPSATPSPQPTATPTPTDSPTPDTRPDPARWAEWRVIPTVSARSYEIYQHGLELGNDTHAFSRAGDCESAPQAFLGFYVQEWAWLPDGYQYLWKARDQFHDSFDRVNITVGDGWWPADLFSSLKANPSLCTGGETPLECEQRLYKPSLVFISLGTNGAQASEKFEKYLRQAVEFYIENGVVPILVTKADNLEGDHSINRAIAQVAHDYDVPLFNFWAAVQQLSNQGLEADGAHLTTNAEDTRNFDGLMVLYQVWVTLTSWGQPTRTP